MKRFCKLVLLALYMLGMIVPAWGQASTQGLEFWVSSTLACSPEKDRSKVKQANPYLAISSEKACTVTITGGVGNAINITQRIVAGSWNEFGNTSKAYNTDPTQGMINVQMDASKWYPIATAFADDVINLKGQTNNYGLHVTATDTISVYVILSASNSMDASNILPLTAIGTEYYTQDYKPEANDFSKIVSMITVLATEDNTQVKITPKGGTAFTIPLQQGQTYYHIGNAGEQLAGTHIQSIDDKKIAVFSGAALTRVPNGRAARDATFEQSMPIQYWGTQFITTRSLGKDGNLIGITATNNGTEIKIDGDIKTYINEGETYYIMLQNASDPWNTSGTITSSVDDVITADAIFIETSCPCAVFSYDTGRDFKGSSGSEVSGHYGDPSSVWISPVQQKIKKITFGTCYTSMTKDHFLNVVTETATCQNTKLTALYGASTIDKTSILSWTPVPGNSQYSYARAKIGDASTSNYSVFRLENAKGFIATVYGNGDDESYAYSAGSAAVELGVSIGDETFTNGDRSDKKFCMGTELKFDATIGTGNVVTRVDWDFGDGTTQYNSEPVTTHTYNTPGWYDVTAQLYGHQACTDESDQDLGLISFTFRVWQQDTVIVEPSKKCLTPYQQDSIINAHGQDGQAYLDSIVANPQKTIVNPGAPCDEDIQISVVTYGLETERNDTVRGRDSIWVYDRWWKLEDPDFPADSVYRWTEDKANEYYCNIYVSCKMYITTCLGLDIPNNPESQIVCLKEDLPIGYIKDKGDIDGKALFTIDEIPSFKDSIVIPNSNTKTGTLYLGLDTIIKKPGYYTVRIAVNDLHCPNDESHLEKPEYEYVLNFTVLYPSDIFQYKFNNVLAVYKPGFGGNTGYEFSAYQWYRNGVAIPGATESILYLGQGITFNEGDIVLVELTDKSGLTLKSCPQTIDKVNNYAPESNNAPRKVLQDQRIRILRDGSVYDIYGQKVK